MNSTQLQDMGDTQFCFEFVNISCPKTNRSTAVHVALYILFVVIIIITILGNSLVMLSILHFRKLQTPTNYLVLSLAVTDFLVGLIVLPYSMIRSVDTCWYFGDIFCKIHSGLDMVLTITSIYHLCFIAIDRYYAVCEPLLYTTKITLPVIGIFITFSWVFSIVYGFALIYSDANVYGIEDYISAISCYGSCVLIFNKLWGHLDPLIAFFVPVLVIVYIYLKIFFVARQHARAIGNVMHRKNVKQENNIGGSHKKEFKAAVKLGVVIGVFIICWLPFFIITIVDPYIDFSTPPAVFEMFVWLGYFNSTCNPMLYAFFYPWFRKALKMIISCKIFEDDSTMLNMYPE
ncbi:trace amine-associated receptor 4-like [Heterodontus francisci]|uniref:trace amine-associated receptor 4-like n=1 Tax=Heterodontus francisci TaxID=7792 RepID=UPI00355B56E8